MPASRNGRTTQLPGSPTPSGASLPSSSSTPESDNSQQRRPLIVSLIPKAHCPPLASAPDTPVGRHTDDTTSDDNTIISCDGASAVAVSGSSEQLRSCLSRRASSVTAAAPTSAACPGGGCTRRHVEYNERAVVIDANGRLVDEALALRMIEDMVEMHSSAAALADERPASLADDDEVFSDSIEPQLPRGDMCTPYPKKRTSFPGLMYLPDWFGEENARCVFWSGAGRQQRLYPLCFQSPICLTTCT